MSSRWVSAGTAALAATVLGLASAVPARAASTTGQWRFDEAGQRAIDDGPYGLDGRLGTSDGADPFDPLRIAGRAGGALRFDGTTFVRLPAAPELAPPTLTVEAVVRGGSTPGKFKYVVSRGASECLAGSYGLYTAELGGMAFYVFDGARYVVSATAGPAAVWDGRWHHVAGVFDGQVVRLYLDGHPVGEPTPAPLTIAFGLTSSDTYLGTYRGTCDLGLRGDLDLVRLSSGALDASQVAARSAAAVGTPAGAVPGEPLAPAAPGTTIDDPRPPGAGPPPSAPGAPPRACTVRVVAVVRKAARRHVVRVNVRLRGRPLSRARVVARQRGTMTVVGSARTGRDGRARLRLARGVAGRVRLAVVGRRDCSDASVRVRR